MKGGGTEGLIALAVIVVVLAYAALYVAIAAGVCLVLFGLFLLFRSLYIGRVRHPKADPLFTKAAKDTVKNKEFDQSRFAAKHEISSERTKYIKTQLEYAGIIKNDSVNVERLGGLHDIFKEINSHEDFFFEIVEKQAIDIQSSIENQINNESNELVISILNALKNNVNNRVIVGYLKKRLVAYKDYASQDDIDKLSAQIASYDSTESQICVNINSEFISAYQQLQQLKSNHQYSRIWSKNHNKIKWEMDSFCNIFINGQLFEALCFSSNGVTYYFYPSFVIRYNGADPSDMVHIYDYKSINVNTWSFTQKEESWFSSMDAKKAYCTWLHSCKDGSPDLRYNYNPSTSHYYFYGASIPQLGFEFICGEQALTEDFRNSVSNVTAKKNTNVPQKNTRNVPQLYDSNSSSALGIKIKKVISLHSIQLDTIKNKTFVSLLNDYQAFDSLEEKASARILKQAVFDGTMETVLSKGLISIEAKQAIDKFIISTGFDEKKARSIISDVYYGFNP